MAVCRSHHSPSNQIVGVTTSWEGEIDLLFAVAVMLSNVNPRARVSQPGGILAYYLLSAQFPILRQRSIAGFLLCCWTTFLPPGSLSHSRVVVIVRPFSWPMTILYCGACAAERWNLTDQQ